MPKWLGPFEVSAQVGPVAVRLELPAGMRMHPVFHVSLVKRYRDDGKVQLPPPTYILDSTPFYTVHKL